MLLFIMRFIVLASLVLYIVLANLMLFAALSNAVCLHNASFLQMNSENAFYFHFHITLCSKCVDFFPNTVMTLIKA